MSKCCKKCCSGCESWSHEFAEDTSSSTIFAVLSDSTFTFTAPCAGTYEFVTHVTATSEADSELAIVQNVDGADLDSGQSSSTVAVNEAMAVGNLKNLDAGVHTFIAYIASTLDGAAVSTLAGYTTIRCIRTPL